jgi:5'-3' exonuclease
MRRCLIVTVLPLVSLHPIDFFTHSYERAAGAPFMARLSEQMRYFINKKITEDSNWRDLVVVSLGHEVLGEGGHKIMEYIRLLQA